MKDYINSGSSYWSRNYPANNAGEPAGGGAHRYSIIADWICSRTVSIELAGRDMSGPTYDSGYYDVADFAVEFNRFFRLTLRGYSHDLVKAYSETDTRTAVLG